LDDHWFAPFAAGLQHSLYINYVVARAARSLKPAHQEWSPPTTAASSCSRAWRPWRPFGFIAFRELEDIRWLFGALVAIASWPYTYLAIVPLNNRILALIGADAAHEARKVISLWGRLEIGQTALGLLATLIYVWAAG
jgi:hypothetical protein